MKQFISILSVLFWIGSGSYGIAAQSFDLLDESEQKAMADTFQYSLENSPSSQDSEWVNPDRDHSGKVKPLRTFYNNEGAPCREFTQSIIIADREEQGYGTACRQPDGHWKIVSDLEPTTATIQPEPTQNRTIVYIRDTSWPAYYLSSHYASYDYWYPYYYPSTFSFSFNHIYYSGNYYKRSRIKPHYNDDKHYPSYKIRTDYGRHKKVDKQMDRRDRYLWRDELRHNKNIKKQHRKKSENGKGRHD